MHKSISEIVGLRLTWRSAKAKCLRENTDISREKLMRAQRVADAMDFGFEHLSVGERRDARYENMRQRIAALI